MTTASDILIVGGGIIGLSLAVELRSRGSSATVLCRDFKQAAAHAAAGMLAPQAENIPPSAMLDLCLQSRALYPDWVRKLEQTTGMGTQYWSCGILAPVFASAESFTLTPNPSPIKAEGSKSQESALWLDRDAIHRHQPGLGLEVAGGWWYPEDAQVDNRALALVLRAAAKQLGVDIQEGVTVEAFEQHNGRVVSVKTSAGAWCAEHYVLATGAWSKELLPVPVYPKKGQMLSVRVPVTEIHELSLQRVLFGEEIYIVPRQDGRIAIGATSEDVGFTPDNTPAGIQALLTRAIRLYPQLKDYPIQEIWWGFRPATPDEMPILGSSAFENLTLATGHYRNGILLAPVTALLMADLILQQKSDPLLADFHYSRFA